ncbi:MBL fold metallo-hydrolase [Comamonas sp. J-3]|uniref:MBL fold metallo-hydrolase n=1 Tax=Comamonas trifloxystrobinivorans TaxID=3350256 RepID=UPI00372BAF87
MTYSPPSSPSAGADFAALPGLQFIERGWLSANNTVFTQGTTAVVDTGYCIHAEQTLALVESALQGAPLQRIVNTHLHSDHCGGNALLQQHWPQARTSIAPGDAQAVQQWDVERLSYRPTGQDCPRFVLDDVLQPGGETVLGLQRWQVHAAPGHDPHSVILFEPQTRTLISADALWEAGFGVVFPEIEGIAAFDEVAATLDVIEQLQPAVVLPGHGGIFTDVAAALATARRRLDGFVRHPERHALYAAKVLLKYKLLEWQQLPLAQVYAWLAATPYYGLLHQGYFADQPFADWSAALVADLQRSGAAQLVDGVLFNS